MTPETKELFAKRYMQTAMSEDLIDWAVSLLEAGFFTKNVSILAGLTTSYAFEAEDYFKRSLNDLKWVAPEREECLRWYARATAEKILNGEVAPADGCNQIYNALVAMDGGDFAHWSCLNCGHAPCGTYDELSGDKLDMAIRREARLLLDQKVG